VPDSIWQLFITVINSKPIPAVPNLKKIMQTKKITCPFCKWGTLVENVKTRVFKPNKNVVTVELLSTKCESCGLTTVLAAQHLENLKRLAARKKHYGKELMGEEYISFRKRYGLTQKLASTIFGKGIIAFSRYENEKSYPDASTRILIKLAINHPEVLKDLALMAGVSIPLEG